MAPALDPTSVFVVSFDDLAGCLLIAKFLHLPSELIIETHRTAA
jgi:hypothetical protein